MRKLVFIRHSSFITPYFHQYASHHLIISRVLLAFCLTFIAASATQTFAQSDELTEEVIALPTEYTLEVTDEVDLDRLIEELGITDDYNVEIVEENTSKACVKVKDPIQLAWFYKPATDGTTTQKLTDHFDTFVFTRNDESHVATVKSNGNAKVLQYLHFDNIHDPCRLASKPKGSSCTCNKPTLNNQAAWNPNDICNIRDNHPSWFLRDHNNKLLYYNDDLMVDPGNENWQKFWLDRVKISQEEAAWDGVFIDNLATEFGLHKGDRSIKLKKYPNIKKYQKAVRSFLKYQYNNYFKPEGKLFYANTSVYWGQTPAYLKYMKFLDGSQDEFWATPRDGYYSQLSWEDRLLRMDEALKMGKSVILVTQGSKKDYSRQRFALASYLLIADSKVFFRYSNDKKYGEFWNYDNYASLLGNPLGKYKKNSTNGVWKRKFENGKVKVNPNKRTAKIKIKNANGNVCD